jgi:hypothetical protein
MTGRRSKTVLPGKDTGRRNESYDGLLFPPEQSLDGVKVAGLILCARKIFNET